MWAIDEFLIIRLYCWMTRSDVLDRFGTIDAMCGCEYDVDDTGMVFWKVPVAIY